MSMKEIRAIADETDAAIKRNDEQSQPDQHDIKPRPEQGPNGDCRDYRNHSGNLRARAPYSWI